MAQRGAGTNRLVRRIVQQALKAAAFRMRYRICELQYVAPVEAGMAEVQGNRTHRTYLPVNPTGFEVQADHQAGFTSAR